jgi:hypothetical protein
MATTNKTTTKRPRKTSKSASSGETNSKVTTNHDRIREWVEERSGKPAIVKSTSGNGVGILRIDFPGYSGEDSLEQISWDEFFAKFERSNLAFLYQEQTSGGDTSRFNKFISRDEINRSESEKSED